MSAPLRALFAGRLFRRLLATRVVSQLGDGLFQLATASLLLFENPGPNPVIDLLAFSAVTLIPFSVLGPFAGVFIDRWDRRLILTMVPLVRAAAAIAVAATVERSIAFYLLVLVVLSANRFFLATVSAELPLAVPRETLLTANAVQTTGGSIASVLGQGAGSLVAGAIGGVRSTLVAGGAFAAVALIARGVPTHRGHDVGPPAPLRTDIARLARELREGAAAVWSNPRVRRALTAITLVQVGVGAIVGVLIHTFITALDLEVQEAAVILGILAGGLAIGVVTVPLLARRISPDQMIAVSFAVAALACLGPAFSLTRAAMIASAGVIGFSYAFVKIPVDTIVQEEVPDARRGRAFALYDVLFNIARVSGIALAAWAFELGAGAAQIVVLVAIAFAALAAAMHAWGTRLRAAASRSRPLPSA